MTVVFFPVQGLMFKLFFFNFFLCNQCYYNKCLLFETVKIKKTQGGLYLLFRCVFLSGVYELLLGTSRAHQCHGHFLSIFLFTTFIYFIAVDICSCAAGDRVPNYLPQAVDVS